MIGLKQCIRFIEIQLKIWKERKIYFMKLSSRKACNKSNREDDCLDKEIFCLFLRLRKLNLCPHLNGALRQRSE